MQINRVPVVLGELSDLRPHDVILVQDTRRQHIETAVDLPPSHAPGCTCCAARDPWAELLGGLFVAMIKGERPRFDRVLAVVDDAGAARLAAVVTEDRLVAARFRLC